MKMRWLVVIGGLVVSAPAMAGVEVGLGLGVTTAGTNGGGSFANVGGGPNFTIAMSASGRLRPDLELGGRVVGSAGSVQAAFLGPVVEYWPRSTLWVGAGVGLAGAAQSNRSEDGGGAYDGGLGFGLDLRVGFVVGTDAAIAIEALPALVEPAAHSDVLVNRVVVLFCFGSL